MRLACFRRPHGVERVGRARRRGGGRGGEGRFRPVAGVGRVFVAVRSGGQKYTQPPPPSPPSFSLERERRSRRGRG
eukprot:8672772-Pyramimonas_sp.AAC.1